MSRCQTMGEVRENIDRVDRQIVTLLGERAGYVREAARIKTRREDIVDPARIEDVVAKARGCAREYALAPELVDAIYRLMINRFILLETEEFNRLHDSADG